MPPAHGSRSRNARGAPPEGGIRRFHNRFVCHPSKRRRRRPRARGVMPWSFYERSWRGRGQKGVIENLRARNNATNEPKVVGKSIHTTASKGQPGSAIQRNCRESVQTSPSSAAEWFAQTKPTTPGPRTRTPCHDKQPRQKIGWPRFQTWRPRTARTPHDNRQTGVDLTERGLYSGIIICNLWHNCSSRLS